MTTETKRVYPRYEEMKLDALRRLARERGLGIPYLGERKKHEVIARLLHHDNTVVTPSARTPTSPTSPKIDANNPPFVDPRVAAIARCTTCGSIYRGAALEELARRVVRDDLGRAFERRGGMICERVPCLCEKDLNVGQLEGLWVRSKLDMPGAVIAACTGRGATTVVFAKHRDGNQLHVVVLDGYEPMVFSATGGSRLDGDGWLEGGELEVALASLASGKGA